jgi:hypothetical protein
VTPDENEIVGEWVLDGTKVRKDAAAERIEALTNGVLEKLADSKEAGGWETLYRDPTDGRLCARPSRSSYRTRSTPRRGPFECAGIARRRDDHRRAGIVTRPGDILALAARV